MKQIYLPLIVGTLANVAAAQSTPQPVSGQDGVSMYGIVDATYSQGSGSISNKTALTSGGNMTSRIGFKGERSMPNGLKAGFVYEAQVFTDSGEGQPTNTTNQTSGTSTAATGTQGLTFARRSTVSLMGGLGEVRLGRDFTAHYRNRVEVDPFGNAGVGSIQPFSGSIGGTTSTRASNMIGYFLPADLNGFYGQFQHYLGENASNSTEPNSGEGNSIRVGREIGKLNISLATGRTSFAKTATTGNITSSNIGVQYDFGVFKLMTGYYRDTVSRDAQLTAKGWTVGGIAPYGDGQFKIAMSRYGTDATGNPETGKLSLGYVHTVMPNTVAYATYARVTNSGGATSALSGSTTAANKSSNGYDVGLRYSF